jgi:RHS repeat-associated protein
MSLPNQTVPAARQDPGTPSNPLPSSPSQNGNAPPAPPAGRLLTSPSLPSGRLPASPTGPGGSNTPPSGGGGSGGGGNPAADIATTLWAGSDGYLLPADKPKLQTVFVAEGRIGGVADGSMPNYELDIGPSTANPATDTRFPWDHRAAGFPFTVTYKPDGQGGGTVTFVNGDVPQQTLTYVVPVNSWGGTAHHDAIFLRTESVKAGAVLSIGNLEVQTQALGASTPLPAPDGTFPAYLQTAGPKTKNTLQISGVDLQQGFTLKGRTFWKFPSGAGAPSNAELAFQVYVGTFQPPVPVPTLPKCNCDCGCGGGTKGLPQEAPNSNGGDPASRGTSGGSPRFNGDVEEATPGLSSGGFGATFGHMPTWTNQDTFATDREIYPQARQNGMGQMESELPWLLKDGQTVVAVTGATDARFFDFDGANYQPRFFIQDTLTHDANNQEFILTDTQGNTFYFYDFSGPVSANRRGQLKRFTDPFGNRTSVAAQMAGGQIQEVQRTSTLGGSTVTESFLYDYTADGLVARVTLQRQTDGGPETVVRRMEYTYYDDSDPNGNAGDLKTATYKDGSGNVLDTTYYRYYKDDGPGRYRDGLKSVFTYESYARLVAAVGSPFTATDTQVNPYADTQYVYDSQHRVIQEVIQGAGSSTRSGGQGTYQYEYMTNMNTGFNSWHYKTVETLPDGNQNVTYSNSSGEVMLKVFHEQSSGRNWETFYQYDDQGRIILMANPSALNGFDETKPDLLNKQAGHYQYMHDDRGLITRTDYYTSTTAGETTPGGVAGYFQDEQLQRGQLGTPILQHSTQYFAHSGGGATVYPTATDTVYRKTDGTGAETTSYAYTWYDNSTRMQSMTVSRPVISADQNGPGTADVTMYMYDSYGREVSMTDPDGFVTTTAYDQGTGAVIQTVRDAGGLNLTTQMEVDTLGRTTKLTDPNGNVTYTGYNDPNHEMRTYPGWQTSTNRPTGPTQVTREDRGHDPSYTETLTMSAAPHVTNGRPDGTEAISNLQTLLRTFTSKGGQVIESDAYFKLTGLTYTTNPTIGTEDMKADGTGNYYAMRYAYDERGRQNRVQAPSLLVPGQMVPTSTINRTVYDGLSRVVSTWVGTDDTPDPGQMEWTPDTVGPPDNMVQVSAHVYDQATTDLNAPGGVGDSNLTQMTQFPRGGAAPRVTQHFYDWRNRQVASKSGVQPQPEDTVTHRPITYTEYDNRSQAIAQEQYDGDGVTITITNRVPDRPAANLLRARSTAVYDDQHRVFRTHTFNVDQTNGTISANSLTTDTFYDHRGNAIKTAVPGGLVTKMQYDGVNRMVKTFTTDGLGDFTWADAFSVTNNIVLSQTQTDYDANSNRILVTSKQRFHNETAAGELGDPTTGPKARVSYMAYYYDAADRLTDSVNGGTNGGTAYTRPMTVPDRSDIVLITSTTYNDAGWVESVRDPRGISTRTEYDNLQRTTRTIEAYTDGMPRDTDNRITAYTYDGANHVLTRTAVLPGGVMQQTRYVYGVAGSVINSNDLLAAMIYPPNGQPNTESYAYNALGEVITKQERNLYTPPPPAQQQPQTHTYGYDVLGRLTADAVTVLGDGLDGQVRRIETAYDTGGRPFLYTSYDDPVLGGPSHVVSQVQQVYNGLSQLITEYQSNSGPVNVLNTPKVQYAYSEMSGAVNHSRLISMTYPNQAQLRVLTYNYAVGLDDRISRLTSLSDNSATLEVYSYLGLDTVVQRSHPQPGVDLTYIQPGGIGEGGDQYVGLDRFGRVVDQRWVKTSTNTDTDHFQYGYDRDGNRLYRDNVLRPEFGELYHASGVSDTYDAQGNLLTTGYDRLNRLTAFSRGVLSASMPGSMLDTIASPVHSQNWALDAVGNWNSFTSDSTTQNRTHNLQNQITMITGPNQPMYDNNGNTTRDETGKTFVYDAWNRLVQVNGASTVSYTYDALNRRITENPGTLQALYYTDAWQVIEERDNLGVTQAQYVWSPIYADALVERDRGTERLYVQQDANWNVTAAISASGTVVERYVYDPYGQRTILNASWDTIGSSTVAWVYGHQGLRFVATINLYDNRRRWYSPSLGRFITMDPMQFPSGQANSYLYLGDSPSVLTDSTGLRTEVPYSHFFGAYRNQLLKEREADLEKLGDAEKKFLQSIEKLDFVKACKDLGDLLQKATNVAKETVVLIELAIVTWLGCLQTNKHVRLGAVTDNSNKLTNVNVEASTGTFEVNVPGFGHVNFGSVKAKPFEIKDFSEDKKKAWVNVSLDVTWTLGSKYVNRTFTINAKQLYIGVHCSKDYTIEMKKYPARVGAARDLTEGVWNWGANPPNWDKKDADWPFKGEHTTIYERP